MARSILQHDDILTLIGQRKKKRMNNIQSLHKNEIYNVHDMERKSKPVERWLQIRLIRLFEIQTIFI